MWFEHLMILHAAQLATPSAALYARWPSTTLALIKHYDCPSSKHQLAQHVLSGLHERSKE
jgi:hypothetical protein